MLYNMRRGGGGGPRLCGPARSVPVSGRALSFLARPLRAVAGLCLACSRVAGVVPCASVGCVLSPRLCSSARLPACRELLPRSAWPFEGGWGGRFASCRAAPAAAAGVPRGTKKVPRGTLGRVLRGTKKVPRGTLGHVPRGTKDYSGKLYQVITTTRKKTTKNQRKQYQVQPSKSSLLLIIDKYRGIGLDELRALCTGKRVGEGAAGCNHRVHRAGNRGGVKVGLRVVEADNTVVARIEAELHAQSKRHN